MNKREIPYKTGWLKRYLSERLQIDIPLEASAEDIEAICNDIPSDKWKRLKGAWRKYNHTPAWQIMMNSHANKTKQLGFIWKKLIARGWVEEEDALTIAEKFSSFGAYSDGNVKYTINQILADYAQRLRKTKPNNSGALMNSVQAIIKMHPDTTVEELSEQCGVSPGEIILAKQKLEDMGKLKRDNPLPN